MSQRPLVIGFALLVAALWAGQERLGALVRAVTREAAPPETVALGSTKPARSIEDIAELTRLCDKVARTWPRQPVEPADADALERYMQPDQPVETRARAMRFGQVIGQERFRKVLLTAWRDPDPRMRRTAVGKADADLDLWPSMVPDLSNDPDAQVRGTWQMWISTTEFRARTGRDAASGKSVRPPPSPAR